MDKIDGEPIPIRDFHAPQNFSVDEPLRTDGLPLVAMTGSGNLTLFRPEPALQPADLTNLDASILCEAVLATHHGNLAQKLRYASSKADPKLARGR